MANPNKTVKNFRKKNPFPQRSPRPDQVERMNRMSLASEKVVSKEWTTEQGLKYIETGEVPK